MESYDFLAPQRIAFGWGRRRELGALAKTLGDRALLLFGSRTLERSGKIDELVAECNAGHIEVNVVGAVTHEPTVAMIDLLVRRVRDIGVRPTDLVIGVGGGSSIDAAKAIAALAPQKALTTSRDYLEGVPDQKPLVERPLPVLAMPTTGGTGSEATKNAVIAIDKPPVKRSLRADAVLPRVVLVDPELSVQVSRETTAWTGMDCITQLIESYISRRASPIPDALCIDGLRRAIPALPVAVENGRDRAARETMAHAAMLSGISLANAGLGMAHGVAAALGALANVPHGLACAVMLSPTLRMNRDVSLHRLAELARFTLPCKDDQPCDDAEAADRFIDTIQNLCDQVGVPRRLSKIGVTRNLLDPLVAGSRGNSMRANPREVTDSELRELLEEIL